jgi:hypothetical protein
VNVTVDELERLLWAYWRKSGMSANSLAKRLKAIAKDIEQAERDIKRKTK